MIKFLKYFLSLSLFTIPLYFLWADIFDKNNIKIVWFIAYYYLVLTLLVTPISHFLNKFIYTKKYVPWFLYARRPLWIVFGILVFIHQVIFDNNIYNLWLKYYSTKQDLWEFLYNSIFKNSTETILWMDMYAFWFWVIGLFITLILFLISNNFSQKKLWAKLWKNIQKWAYPLFIILFLHIYFVWWWKEIYMYPAIFLIIMRWLVFLNKKYKFL